MMLRIFLTSDLHLGMKFAGYPEVQVELSEARFKTLEGLVASANERECNLFIIAGDLFDCVTLTKRDVIRAAHLLKDFHGQLVTVLPGNHDFISRGQTDLWSLFKENAGDHVLVLEEERISPLLHYDLEAHLYPAPCRSKHSSENGLRWIRETPKDRSIKHHLGIAHGSLEGFSPDFDGTYYPMTQPELLACELDLWLLGHTHSPYPVNPGQHDRIFYPGTPEPDGFDCQHGGQAWILELAEDGTVMPLSLPTGTYRFLHADLEIRSPRDLDGLKKTYATPEHKKTLLKMKLKGRIPRDEYRRLSDIRKSLEEQLLYLSWNDAEVHEEITMEGIHQEFTEGSFPHRLLTSLALSGDSEALQIAYELLQELRKRS